MRRALLHAALLGALAVPAFGLPFALVSAVSPAPTWHALLPLLPLLSLIGLLRLVEGQAWARAAALGWAWGAGCFGGGVSWVYVSLSQFSGLPAPVAALATAVLCAYLALFPALACGAAAWLNVRRGVVAAPALFAALWALSEWLRGTLLTGFPWLSIGYAQVPPSPLAGYASAVGVYGVGFFSVLIAGWLLQARAQRRALLGVVLVLAAGQLLRAMPWTTPTGQPVEVRLLQGNVAQDVKWRPEFLEQSIVAYLGLINNLERTPPQGPALTVLPETAIPLLFDQIPPELIGSLARRTDVLLGAAVRTLDDGYANGAVAIPKGRDRPEGIYAKHHLVPFGEYPPPGLRWFFDWMRLPMSEFTAGSARQPPLRLAGLAVAPNICYEDLFGEELLPALNEATLLINLSNTAWFGDSLAQPQHLQIARLRALETGRVMLRATNSGMTAMIQPDGSVSARLRPFTTDVLRVEAQGYTGLTPYARWGNALVLVIALALIVPALRRRTPAGS